MHHKIIDGKAHAQSLMQKIKTTLTEVGIQPSLHVVLVGDNPASEIYVSRKQEACGSVGILSTVHRFAHDVLEDNLKNYILKIANDSTAHGILVQLPLPPHINASRIIEIIPYDKDVDGLTSKNQGLLMAGGDGIRPCTPEGCLQLLKTVVDDLSGKIAVVLGRSALVGAPLAYMLQQENCTVIQCHSKTIDVAALTSIADIVICAMGRPQFLKAHMIKENAIIIDVGINRLPDNTIVGDVDFNDCLDKSGFITPVPGGVGPMTVVNLLLNTVKCYNLQMKL
jgi:methylenetetrahydrofolate dehydrogenase (NADP+)/methenyltetrahydrofolate cyclohydrolase